MLQPGDKVAIVDDVVEGRVVTVQGSVVTIESTEGFLLKYDKREVVKLDSEAIFYGPIPSSILKDKEAQRNQKPRKSRKREEYVLEVDLHLEAILPSDMYLEHYQKLPFQLNVARERLEKAMADRIPRMVFIHGKGDGILKTELYYLLSRYSNINFYPAEQRRYSGGAVEVYFIQNSKD